MHICHITIDHTPYDDRIYYRELWSLIGWADRITLVAKDELEPDLAYPEIEIVNFPRVKVLKRLPYIREIVTDLQPDIIHLHEPELLLLLPYLRRKTDAAIIYDMHEPLAEVIREFSRAPRWKRYLLSFILGTGERSVLSYLDGVIHTSLPLYTSLHTANPNSTIIYNFPRLDIFEPREHTEPEEFTILYQGQIAPARGILELLEAFYHFYRREQHGHLRIIGYIHPVEFEETIRQAIKYYSISHAVTLEKEIQHSKMPEVLANSSVGVMALLPSRAFQKSVQGKTFEYMATGLPAIAGNYASAYQFIGNTQSGIVLEDSDPHTISAALSTLANNPDRRKKMSHNAQQAVRKQFRWDRMGERLRDFYVQVLNNKRGRLSRIRWRNLSV